MGEQLAQDFYAALEVDSNLRPSGYRALNIGHHVPIGNCIGVDLSSILGETKIWGKASILEMGSRVP